MLSKEYGIKGTPILSEIDSLCFPQSFSPDFMHMAWENIMSTVTTLWSGNYKGLDEGTQKYHIEKAAWKEAGSCGAATSLTIPLMYGPWILDISEKGSYMMANMWSFWTQFLVPILLQDLFKDPKCYEHFIHLVYLFGVCLQCEILTVVIGVHQQNVCELISTYLLFSAYSHFSPFFLTFLQAKDHTFFLTYL